MEKIKKWINNNWIFVLIIMQPLLDVLAYFRADGSATEAGYIRLAIMLILPLYLLITLEKKRNFIIMMSVIGVYCILHVLNCFRVGYMNPYFDIAYIAKIAQMPILAVCFIHCIRDELTKKQAVSGILCAAAISLVMLLISAISGTYMATYDGVIGISGWVTDDNRCANSVILVIFSSFAMYYASKSKNKLVSMGIPVVMSFVLLANGTSACYLGLFAVCGGFAGFSLFKGFVKHEKIQKCFIITLVLLIIAAVLVYPYTPRAAISAKEANTADRFQNELELQLIDRGYDPESMSFEDKFNNPEVKEIFGNFYYKIMGHIIPDMYEQFGIEKVLIKYNMTTDAETLIDVRLMKTTYASLIWDECDSFTKLVGFEVTRDCGKGLNDMENDWHAIFYYCGYLGFGLYAAFVVYFIVQVIRRLIKDFKGSLNLFNCCILICYVLLLGLAHFSGAVLRRPHVSIYMSLIIALINYQTCILPIDSEKRT